MLQKFNLSAFLHIITDNCPTLTHNCFNSMFTMILILQGDLIFFNKMKMKSAKIKNRKIKCEICIISYEYTELLLSLVEYYWYLYLNSLIC